MGWQNSNLNVDRQHQRGCPVVKPELGAKRTCPECAARFYDLLKEPIVCPMCEFTFVAEPLLPSKSSPPPKPKEEVKVEAEKETTDDEDVEVVSLDDIEEEGADDAEDPDVAAVAEIEDVELDDDDDSKAESDKFLEDDDDEGGDVSGILGVKPGAEDV
jgi:uncharacterized protein (TIGR02300 family)